MNVLGIGRLVHARNYAARERRLAAWLAELRKARMTSMTDVTRRFASAKPRSETAAEFALFEGLVVETLFCFPAGTVLIRSANETSERGTP